MSVAGAAPSSVTARVTTSRVTLETPRRVVWVRVGLSCGHSVRLGPKGLALVKSTGGWPCLECPPLK